MWRKFREDTRYLNELSKFKHKCSCGHSIIIFRPNVKKLCKWCGHYVYINEREKERDEFKKKVRGMLK